MMKALGDLISGECPLPGSQMMPYCSNLTCQKGFPDSSVGKKYACNVGDPSSIPGLGRSPGEGKGYPLQYSGLENTMGCIVHRVAKRHD